MISKKDIKYKFITYTCHFMYTSTQKFIYIYVVDLPRDCFNTSDIASPIPRIGHQKKWKSAL